MRITGEQASMLATRVESRAKGRAEGRTEGRIEGQRELLREQAEFKFGPLPPRAVARMNALTTRQVRELAQRILAAQSLAELGF